VDPILVPITMDLATITDQGLITDLIMDRVITTGQDPTMDQIMDPVIITDLDPTMGHATIMVLLNPKLILNKKNSLPIEGYFFCFSKYSAAT
jgi:hypothetical protein